MAIIRITGLPGAGKSTLAEKIAEHLHYDLHTIGRIFEARAAKDNLPIGDYYERLNDPEFEKEIDNLQEELMLSRDDLVVDGRMAPWLKCGFLAVNVKIVVEPDEGAQRLLRRPENAGRTVAEMMDLAARRVATEREHYRDIHGIADHLADRNFDIILDTTHKDAEGTFREFLESFQMLIQKRSG
ncbi:AAA family ATPase [Patescibacteria group bacterium]|nr:AAA family ATPase [Patescibacteria group bacterium]